VRRRFMVRRRITRTSGPRSSAGVAGTYAPFPQMVQDGGRIDVQAFTDSCEGPAEGVEVDGDVDLIGGEAAAVHRHAVPTEDDADRPPFDAEPGTQLGHHRSSFVSGDEFLDLVGVDLPGPPRFGSIDGRWSRCGGIGQLPKERLQGFYLRFYLVVSSPMVHMKL
jgi:hypothetical protein